MLNREFVHQEAEDAYQAVKAYRNRTDVKTALQLHAALTSLLIEMAQGQHFWVKWYGEVAVQNAYELGFERETVEANRAELTKLWKAAYNANLETVPKTPA